MSARRARRTTAVLAALGLAAGLVAAPASGAVQPVITQEMVGMSAQGRPITVVRSTAEGATRRVLVIGSIHGDERAGERVVRELVRRAELPPTWTCGWRGLSTPTGPPPTNGPTPAASTSTATSPTAGA